MELTIALCGDIMLGGEVGEFIGTATVDEWLQYVSPAWQGADLLIANLESPCVTNAKPVDGPPPELIFSAPAGRLMELAKAGFNALSLANNHILNCGSQGLQETRVGMDRAGICYAGAGMDIEEALQPAFITVAGVVVGLVAFCYGPAAGPSTAGVAPYDQSSIRKALTAARASADLVIASLHDGLEYSDVPPAATRARFRFLADNGADIVFGHHPHVLQGCEWYGKVPIIYSLGDLLFHNSLEHVAARNFSRMAMGRYGATEVQRDSGKFGRGAVLTVHVSGEQRSIRWHPFRQSSNLQPRLSEGNVKEEDLQRLNDLSAALLNVKDPRHALADAIFNAAHWESRDGLSLKQILRLAGRPQWRYFPTGVRWLYRRFKRVCGAI